MLSEQVQYQGKAGFCIKYWQVQTRWVFALKQSHNNYIIHVQARWLIKLTGDHYK